MRKIFIIILNYNGWKDTEECLESFKKLSIINYQLSIVLVNNGSDRNDSGQVPTEVGIPIDIGARMTKILKQVQNDGLNIKIIKNEKNLGFAEGNNVGIRYALENGADEVMILNNDTIVDKNSVNELLKTMEKDNSIGIVGPKIYFSPGYEYHHDRYRENERGKVLWYAGGRMDWENVIGSHRGVDEVDHGQYEKCEPVDFVSGCCLMVRREVLEKVGFFDQKYYLYYEDNDLCQRAKKAGFKIIYEPKAYLWHKNAGSVGGSGSILQDYYTTRNRLLFGMKYAPIKSKLALIKESLKLLMVGRKWQRKGIMDFYGQHFGKGSYKQ